MSSDTRVATIAAVAAIVGALVGGVATYAGNQAILGQQLTREEHQQYIEALGVARVYVGQIRSADDDLRNHLAHGRWPGRNDLSFFELPALEDRRTMQARLPSTSAEAVSYADETMRSVTATIEIEPGNGLTVVGRAQIVTDIAVLNQGETALAAFSE